MPYGVYPVPKHRESTKSSGTGATLAVRIRTRVRRGALDRQLADGADAASNAELELRATQLRSTGERTRLADALVETLGDARRGEPMTLRPRPQRAAVRDAADDILALALRLRDGRPVDLIGVAMTARLVDDRSSPMHRDDAGDLRDAIKSALSALDATPETTGVLQAHAA
jgi:hypothetical protein